MRWIVSAPEQKASRRSAFFKTETMLRLLWSSFLQFTRCANERFVRAFQISNSTPCLPTFTHFVAPILSEKPAVS